MAADRVCETCGESIEGTHTLRRYCDAACKQAAHRKAHRAPAREAGRPRSSLVADALRAELDKLGVAASYEGQIALGIAAQLDGGTVVGAAYASLSKELDRRVEVLRLKAERPDSPVGQAASTFAEKRTHLRSA